MPNGHGRTAALPHPTTNGRCARISRRAAEQSVTIYDNNLRAISRTLETPNVTAPGLRVSLAIWSTITPNFLENQYAQLPPDPYSLSASERLDLAQTAVTYLRLWGPAETVISLLAEQTLPDGTPLYAQSELNHLVDVKYLTDTIRIAGLTSASS